MGQFTYETDGIRQQKWNIAKRYLSYGRINGGKQLVLGQNAGTGKQIHQCRLANIGVPDKRDTNDGTARLALRELLLFNFLKLLLQYGNLIPDITSIGFYLSFAGSATCSCSAALSFEVSPHSGKSRKQ